MSDHSKSTTDHELIRNAIALFSIAIDRKDFDLLCDAFTVDASVEYPEPIGVMHGRSEMADALQYILKDLRTHHALTTQKIELVDHQTATAITYCMAVHFGTGEREGQIVTGWGHYEDELVKGIYDGKEEWRIAKRKVDFHVPPTGDNSLLALEM